MKLAAKLAEIEHRYEKVKQIAVNKMIKDSMIEEFQGIATGITADNVVNDQERNALINWVKMRKEFLTEFPLSDFANLVMNKAKSNEEILLFCKSVALDISKDKNQVIENIYDQVDKIDYDGYGFCISGEFKKLYRDQIEEIITERGGIVKSGVTKLVHYLVIGSNKSDGWAHGKWGRKIEKAIELRKAGLPILIIDEETFLKYI